MRGTIEEIIEESINIKGEFVIVVEGNVQAVDYTNVTIVEHVNSYIKEGLSVNDAIKAVAKDRNLNKKDIYNEYHEIKK